MLITLPRRMNHGNLALRQLRMSDGRFLSEVMSRHDILESGAAGKPGRSSWIFFYWWLRKTFFAAYCIEHNGQVIGFIGLFNLVPGESAEISLVLFDPVLRRRGYGTRAFQLLAGSPILELANTLIARVRKDNLSAHSFWSKLGFQTVRNEPGVMVMIKRRLIAGIEERETTVQNIRKFC